MTKLQSSFTLFCFSRLTRCLKTYAVILCRMEITYPYLSISFGDQRTWANQNCRACWSLVDRDACIWNDAWITSFPPILALYMYSSWASWIIGRKWHEEWTEVLTLDKSFSSILLFIDITGTQSFKYIGLYSGWTSCIFDTDLQIWESYQYVGVVGFMWWSSYTELYTTSNSFRILPSLNHYLSRK